MRRRQDEMQRKILSDRNRKASDIARNAAILRILEALEVSGTYLVGPDGRPGGLRARMRFLFATK